MDREQKLAIWKTVIFIVTLVIIFVGGFFYKMTRPPILNDGQLKGNGVFLFDKPRQLSEFELVQGNGEPFTLDNLSGQWSLVFFGFTYCPDICPTTMATLTRFYQALPVEQQQQIDIDLISVDPARDTPEKIRDYAAYFNADFKGVTGEFLSLKKLATELNIPFRKVPGGGDNYLIDHSGNVAIINPKGHYVGFVKSPIKEETLKLIWPTLEYRYQ